MNNKLLYSIRFSILVSMACLTNVAHAIGYSEGDFSMDINGIVGGFYTQTDCDVTPDSSQWSTFSACEYAVDNKDTASVQNGFLPGWINFVASYKTENNLDLKGHFGFAPGTSNPSKFGGRIAGSESVGDVRNVYLSISGNMGTLVVGRNAALFQYYATFSDITIPGVGTHAEAAGALNTTFGAVATGYTYMSFQPQITYSTPVMNGFQASIGVFQPVDIQPDPISIGGPIYNVLDTPMLQGSMSYDIEGGSKLWTSFVTQKAELSGNTGRKVTATGYELGAKLVLGGFTANLSGFKGDALGDGVMFVGATDKLGNAVETQGFLANMGYKFGDNQLSVQYGITENTDIEGAKNQSHSIVYVRDISKGLQFTLEYTSHTTSQTGFSDSEANTVSSGVLWYF